MRLKFPPLGWKKIFLYLLGSCGIMMPLEEMRMKIADSMIELIGNTPLLRLHGTEAEFKVNAVLLGKCERFNPSGSVKDRAALSMLTDAENRGLIHRGSTIVEPTSGNTGVGLAAIGARLGYRVILTMPDSMSQERIALLKAYGATVVLTPSALGMQGAVAEAERIAEQTGGFLPSQFDNPANPASHRQTAEELLRDTEGRIDVFVAGIGTGGTISGVGKVLKSTCPEIRIVGVEPKRSPLLTEGKSGKHNLQGIGANFIPKTLDLSVVDEIVTVDESDAYLASRALSRRDGLLSGITSGAALYAAVELSRRPQYANKTFVILLADTGERYLSTELFNTEESV